MQKYVVHGVLPRLRQGASASLERLTDPDWFEIKSNSNRFHNEIDYDVNRANVERVLNRLIAQHPHSQCVYATVWAEDRSSGLMEFLLDHSVSRSKGNDYALPPLPMPIAQVLEVLDRMRARRDFSPLVIHSVDNSGKRRPSALGDFKVIQEWLAQQGWKTITLLPVSGDSQGTGLVACYSRETVSLRTSDFESLQYAADVLVSMLLMSRKVHSVRMTTRIDEQRRIARNLHDTTVQDATGAILQLENASSLLAATLNGGSQSPADATEAHQYILQALELSRKLAGDLREKMWDLHAATPSQEDHDEVASDVSRDEFRQNVQSIAKRVLAGGASKLPYRLRIMGAGKVLHRNVSEELSFIITEALNNIVRHANATRVTIAIVFCGPTVCLSVRDNGCGFDQERLDSKRNPASHRGTGFGLMGMNERVKLLNGTLVVSGLPRRGTSVRILVPNEAR